MRVYKALPAYVLHTTALCATLVGMPLAAHAGPENGVVTGGAAAIQSAGNTTIIDQTSDRAIIRWDSFDINSAEHVRFNQPSSGSITVNRIRDTKPSQIDGRISANGNIVLINPNGLVFGSSAVVDVGSVVATTSDLDNDADFLAGGTVKFTRPGAADAKIVNHGTMTVRDAGLVGLVAPHVENNGVIQARMGKVHLASGDIHTVDFAGDGLIRLEVSDSVLSQSVKNTGRIEADGGDVVLSAAQARGIVDALIVNTGTIRAQTITTPGGQIRTGSVTMTTRNINAPAHKGTGRIDNTGLIDVTGFITGQIGGDITILSDAIAIGDGSVLRADGDTRGGSIRIGGDYQGGNNVPTSDTTYVGQHAILSADARRRGAGGQIILWSDDLTQFHGFASVAGGADGGNGGFIEISGKGHLDYTGAVNLHSIDGNNGTLLLDPTDIVISSGANANMSGGPNFSSVIDNAPSVLNVTTLLSALASGNVIVQTRATGAQQGNITVDSALTWSSGHTLTLDAHYNITVNQAINGGGLTMIAGNDIVLNTTIAGTGALDIRQASATGTVGLGNSAVGVLNLNTTEIGRIADGWSSISIGRDDSSGAMDVRGLTWNDNLTLKTGTGIITFNGVQTMGANDLTIITDGNIALNNALTGTGTLTIAQASAGGTMALGNSQTGALNLTTTELGRITNGWASLIFGRTDGSGVVNVGALTWNDNLTLQSGSGVINVNGAQTMGANTLTIMTDADLNLGVTNALYGSSTLTIMQASANTTIGLGDGQTGALNLNTTDVARLRNGWASIVIGRTDGTGDINVGALTWNDHLTLQSGSGVININGVQTMGANNITMRTDADIVVGAGLTSTGSLIIAGASAHTTMGLGDGQAGTIHLSNADLANITNGWTALTFGTTAMTGAMNIGDLTWNDITTFQTGSGQMNINGAQTMGGNNLTLRTDSDLAINAALNGSGTLTIVQTSASTSMGIGDGEVGDMQFSDIELDYLTNGWLGLVFGRTDGTGAMNVAARAWNDPLTLRTGSGQMNINGVQAMGSNALVMTTDSDLAVGAQISGTGALTVAGSANTTSMGVGTGQAGMLVLDNTELSRIQGSRTSITLGLTTATADMNVGAYSWLDPLTLRTGSGSLRINGTQTMAGNNLALLANGDIVLDANLVGTGTVTLSGSVVTATIGIGDTQSGAVHLSDAEMNRIVDGWTTIIIGATNHTGSINIGERTWNDSTTLRVGAGTMNINGTQTMGGNNLTLQAGSNLALNANVIGTGTLSITGASNSISIGIGSGQAGTYSLDDTELGRISDGWGTIIIGTTSMTGAMNIGARTWLDNLDLRTAAGALNINGAQTMGSNNLTIRTNSNLQINDTLSGTGTLTIMPTTASVSMGIGDSQSGTLNLTNTELNRILNGWGSIILGTTTMTGVMNVGSYTWNDNLTLRTGSGVMTLAGATMGSNNLTIQTDSNLVINGAVSGSGTLTIQSSAVATTIGIGDSQSGALSLTNAELNYLTNGWANIILGSATGTGAMNVGARTWQDNLTLRTAAGAMNINGAQTMGANNLTLQTDSGLLIAGALSGSGILTIRQNAVATTMGIGTGQAGTVALSGGELDLISNGWAGISFGRTDGTGAVAIGTRTWNDNVSFLSGTGIITIAGAQTLGSNSLTIQTGSDLALNNTLSGTGTLKILGSLIGTSIGLGTGQAGTIALNDTELGRFADGWSLIEIGRADSTSVMNIGAYTWSDPMRFISGGNIVLNGDQVSTEASGTTLVYATINGAFINNAGADAIDAGGGRYLVYSVDENNDTLGGLIRPTIVTNSYAGYGPGSVAEPGNVYLYSGIVAKVLLIQIDDADKIYGGNLPTLTYTYLGGLQNGDALNDVILGQTLTAVGSSALDDAGTTRVLTGSFTTALGYTVTVIDGTLTVTKATITVTADDDSRMYGDANPALTVSYSGFRNGDDETDINVLATAATGATTLTHVGSYAITASGAVDNNYDFVYVDGTLNITKASLTATAQSTSRVYGDANPTFIYNYTGFRNGDTATDIDTGAIGSSAGATANVGSYTITGSGAFDNNYTFNYVNGTMTVTKAMVTVTADNVDREYGLTNPALTVTYSGLKNGENSSVLDTQATASTGADILSNVGGHIISASGAADTNYNFTYVNGNLNITRAMVTVTADSTSREYGDANPPVGVSYSGFRNGQNNGVLLTQATASSAAGATAGVGTHAVTASGASANNYNFTYVDGVLTVTKATLTATVQNDTREYGDANPVLNVVYTGFKNGEGNGAISTLATTSSAGATANVGTHAITAGGAAADNYNFTYVDGVLTVTKAMLTATANNATRTVDTPNPAFTVSYSGFKNGEGVGVIDTQATASTLATLASPMGTYDIDAIGAFDLNYDFTYVPGTLTVMAAPPVPPTPTGPTIPVTLPPTVETTVTPSAIVIVTPSMALITQQEMSTESNKRVTIVQDRAAGKNRMGRKKKFLMAISSNLYTQIFGVKPASTEESY